MKKFLITFLAVLAAQIFLAGLVIFSTMLIGVAMVGVGGREATVAQGACLVQEIPAELLEYEPQQRLPIPRRVTTHTTILENLEKARHDDRIRRVILRFDVPGGGWGKLQEIRQRVAQLREVGKPVYAYTSFALNTSLYLAAACDSIILAPEGMVWLTGLMAERYYLKEMFARVGIDVQLTQIKEYKAAAEMFTREEMSPEARENAEWVLTDLYEDFCSVLAADRGVDPAAVEQWLQRAPCDPQEALASGLVDDVLYWEELTERLSVGEGEFLQVSGDDYAKISRASFGLHGPEIAVVHGQGMIISGESGGMFPMGASMGDETIVAALETAMNDDRIEGILLRLDTPGGLSLASDRIGKMVARAASRKPLVVSSVDLNASGGYMVSYRCSTIVALPGSIVGSIGAFSMRPTFTGLMDKLGITWDRVTVGPHATLFSPVTPLTDDEFAQLESVQWKGYSRWVAGVAQHRGMSPEQLDLLARGRVFTGRQALANGLIDALGGFDEALALLKDQIGIAADESVTLLHYPVKKNLLEELREGDWLSAARTVALVLGLRSAEQERLAATLTFWGGWLETREPLLVYWWRYR